MKTKIIMVATAGVLTLTAYGLGAPWYVMLAVATITVVGLTPEEA